MVAWEPEQLSNVSREFKTFLDRRSFNDNKDFDHYCARQSVLPHINLKRFNSYALTEWRDQTKLSVKQTGVTEIQLQLARDSQNLRAITRNWSSWVEGLQLATDNDEVKDPPI